MAQVTLQGVSRVFPGGFVAVDQINLEVNDRELLVLVGPSGCGKSTTLRMIAGLEQTSQGKIAIDQREIDSLLPQDRGVAMVFQNYALYPHMTVYQNIAFALELRSGGGWFRRLLTRLVLPARVAKQHEQRKTIKEQVEKAAQLLGIEHLLKRMPRQLSGGECQRVALGRAIVQRPAVFLFDEPLSNLDAQLRMEMRQELKQLHRRLKATIIYVTHDQVEAMTLGDRVAVMREGVIQQIAPPTEIYHKPTNRFVAGFIGSLPMNFLEGERQRESKALSKKAAPRQRTERLVGPGFSVEIPPEALNGAQNAASPHRVVAGIRPEDVLLTKQPGPPAGKAQIVHLDELGDSRVAHLEWIASGEMPRPATPVVLAKLSGEEPVACGAVVDVWLASHRCHWFDPISGNNLNGPSSEDLR